MGLNTWKPWQPGTDGCSNMTIEILSITELVRGNSMKFVSGWDWGAQEVITCHYSI